jgi:signal transduction histidine kinase
MTANILIADDTPENLHLLFGMLTGESYRVRPVPNGLRALSAVQAEIPDLILLDIKMPDIDGYEVCKRLKADERTRDIPVIFISALNGAFDKVKAFSVGAVDYITKPFQVEEVLARVETHLMLQNQRQNLEEKNTQLQQEITRRKQAEEELQELNQQLQVTNRQLQEANDSKNKFFSIIAHDLRSPFTGLIGLTEALVKDLECYSQDRIKTLVSLLHKDSKAIYTLLTNLLEWSRLQQGFMECEPETNPLVTIVRQNMNILRAQAERKQITLRNQIADETLVYADLRMLNGVIRNLLSNALKFTESGGAIEVSAQLHEGYVEMVVSDTGIGMDQTRLGKLFHIDAKSSRRGTADEEGTGLGLILCKEFVEKNGGTIRVKSEVNRGSRFIVSLPSCRCV